MGSCPDTDIDPKMVCESPKQRAKTKIKKNNGIVVYVGSYVAVRIFASCCVHILLMNFFTELLLLASLFIMIGRLF